MYIVCIMLEVRKGEKIILNQRGDEKGKGNKEIMIEGPIKLKCMMSVGRDRAH